MIILIPMGGKGSRFSDAGYLDNKACILTTDRHTNKKLPMIVCAMKDIPEINNPINTIICVDRDFHEQNGTEKIINENFKNVKFIHDHVMLDQAYGCFLAREFLLEDEELFIGACDTGMDIDFDKFRELRKENDALIISHSNDHNIQRDPKAHSWVKISSNGEYVEEIKIKETISANIGNDHATTGMFWFKSAKVFLGYLEEMIWSKDTLDGKYYVDKVLEYYLRDNSKVFYQDVRYLCWGTPEDYELYEQSYEYWQKFHNSSH